MDINEVYARNKASDMQCKAFKQRYKTFYDKTIYEVSDD